ncbi:MAG: hypothetical protein P8180_00905 [Gammaproteobacteria bacterium]|jgi:hypothetical protein
MNYPTALVAAATIVSGTLLAASYAPSAEPGGRSAAPSGRYQIVSGDKNTSWRLDTRSGQVVWCLATGPNYQVHCYGRTGELPNGRY